MRSAMEGIWSSANTASAGFHNEKRTPRTPTA